MGLQQIDAMIGFAIARVSDTPDGYRSVVRDLASDWPDATGAQIVFVIVSAADAIERVFETDPSPRTEVQQAFRVAALLASDLFAMEQRGNFAPTGRDLLDYWQANDPYFLKL